MTSLEDLPEELLARLTNFLERPDLTRIRLVNRRLTRIATQQLFRSITLYAHWAHEDEEEDERHSVDSESDATWIWGGENGPSQIIGGIGDSGTQSDELGFTELPISETTNDVPNTPEQDWTAVLEQENSQGAPKDEEDSSDFDLRDDFESESGDPTFEGNTGISRPRSSSVHHYKHHMPQWAQNRLPGPPGYNAQSFKNILLHDGLRDYVQEVQVYTCETHCDHHPALSDRWFEGSWPCPIYDLIYHECIKRLGDFPNVRSVVVHFDRHAGDDHEEDTLQDPDFQKTWLRRILGPLNGRLTGVALRHYENTGDKGNLPRSETSVLMSTISKITSLRMSVKHRETNNDSGPIYRYANIHPFWNRFVDRFLRPAHDTLSTLVLYSDVPFGWFPKLDLRSIHLNKLRSLTLGHYIFHHDHQIEWIISHGATLQEMSLDRCSILYQIGHSIPDWLDDEGYPKGEDPHNIGFPDYGWSSDPVHNSEQESFIPFFKSWGVRWYEVFPRFAQKLHNLHTFRFGSSVQWNFNTESRYAAREGGNYQLPVIPWRDEQNIVSSILDDRYTIWDDWQQQYRARWRQDESVYAPEGRTWNEEFTTQFAPFPGCRQEDLDALQTLLETVHCNIP